MEKTFFERKYKAFIVDMCNLIKTEQRKVNDVDLYMSFKESARINSEILSQVLSTYERALKGQTYLQLLHEDLKRFQKM